MSFDIHSTFGYSTIISVVSQTGSQIVVNVATGDGARFSVGQQVTICPPGKNPVITNGFIGRISAISTDQITINISVPYYLEGTTVLTVQANWQICNSETNKIFRDIEIPLEKFVDFVVSGLTAPTSGTLATTFAAGVIWIQNQRFPVASDGGHTYTASKDTYVDVDNTGAFTYTAVANGAAAPAITANSIRIAKIVTSGSAVTAVVQLGGDFLGNYIYPTQPIALLNWLATAKARAYLSGNQAVTNATWTKATLNAKSYDPGNNFDAATNFRFTAPVAGKYAISAQETWSIGDGVDTWIAIYKNGVQYFGVEWRTKTSNVQGMPLTDIIDLVAGDYIELWVFQSSGGTTNLINGGAFLAVHLLSLN